MLMHSIIFHPRCLWKEHSFLTCLRNHFMREAFSHIFKHVIIYCAEWSTFSNLHTHAIMPPFITVLFYSSPFALPLGWGNVKKTVEFVVYHYLAFCSNSSCILPYISPGFKKPLSQKNLLLNTWNGGKGVWHVGANNAFIYLSVRNLAILVFGTAWAVSQTPASKTRIDMFKAFQSCTFTNHINGKKV